FAAVRPDDLANGIGPEVQKTAVDSAAFELGALVQRGDLSRGVFEFIPGPSLVRDFHAGGGEQIEVDEEDEGGAILGEPVEGAVAGAAGFGVVAVAGNQDRK